MVLRIEITQEIAQEVDVGHFFRRKTVQIKVGIDVGNAIGKVRYVAQGHAGYGFFMHFHVFGLGFEVSPGEGRNGLQGVF